ncbi:MAG: DEAD/DEAH box helicase [Spirochaetota bacterium]
METFEQLGLSEHSLHALKTRGFEEPTDIQRRCIPLVLKRDKDLLGQAQTGTGKTAAFGLPILDTINSKKRAVQALILTPTRELAIQVAEEINSFTDGRAVRIAAMYGGQSIGMQIQQLKRGCSIVVGTPGRIIDHIQRGTLVLDSIETFVLDEADEMLNMGFIDEVETIMQALPADKMTLLFSATMPKAIATLAKKYMREREEIVVPRKEMTSSLTEQIYIEVRESDKLEALRRIIDVEEEFYGLIFCRTKNGCDELAKRLSSIGYGAEALHGDLTQSQREKVLQQFRDGKVTMLAATDVAARGIDIQNLTHVINYSLPQNPESYIHRIGRTGRAGNQGTAVTFVTPAEYRKIQYIKKAANADINQKQLPGIDELLTVKREKILSEIRQSVEEHKPDDFFTLAEQLQQQHEATTIIAGLLRSQYGQQLDRSQYSEIGTRMRGSEGPNIQKSTRLFIAKGKKHGMNRGSIADYITKVSKVPGSNLQKIEVFPEYSFVSVPFRDAEKIIKAFQRSKPGKKPVVSRAKTDNTRG